MFSLSSITYLFTLILLLANCIQVSKSTLTGDDINAIAANNDNKYFKDVLQKIIVPRIVGTKGHRDVQQFIIDELKSLNFHIELDAFTQNVPIFKNVTFTNIVAKLNPNANEYLTLACHYDSKYFEGQIFYGAVDSAVPCSIMLNVAKTLQANLESFRGKTDISLMLIFFDGEEAFKSWNEVDSLYGSRHLAKKWLAKSSLKTSKATDKEIDRIAVLVLLDLIGESNAKFSNFFQNTEPLHERLVQIERHLSTNNLLERSTFMFMRRSSFAGVDDDHVPFITNDVPVLHLIPTPFPKVWHTIDDNLRNLDAKSIKNFNTILRVFVMDFLTTYDSAQGGFRI